MKSIFKTSAIIAMSAVMATSMISCNDDNSGNSGELSTKEEALKDAVTPYVNNTVIPTYKSMADAAIKLMDACNEARDLFDSDKTGAQAKITEAGDYWKESRKYWELSEAFLFGAAADYNIDPHIDSWPLDKAALDQLLNNSGMMTAIGKGGGAYVSANLGYGLLGFHAIEYMLFQLDASGDKSSARQINSLNKNQMIYMAAVAEDLCYQCVRLEASWAGMDNITTEKQTMLTDNELEPTFNYGESMLNAGQGGSKYVNYTDAAQEILQGCIDIADEVAEQKMGRPANGSSEEDKNYIESPYSLNSTVDFADNIRSIQNAYEGSNDGDKSVSDYIASVDADKDKALKDAIDAAITAIENIPEPFAKNATGQATKDAITAVAEVSNSLSEVARVLNEN
ncbi:MAG: hypothetical protein H9802_13860 [Candidatus Phocaeicola faecipullorum]|nr:hypothetical protein [Candidatus Phocaeicola faecipullorum]